MKKRILFVCLLVCGFILCGCECRHEWREADCLNPAVCTECAVTDGEALGHHWQAADCAQPETCARCGETRGEPLDHSFGEYAFEGDQMYRNCTLCGHEERSAADWEFLIGRMLEGFWETEAFVMDGDYAAVHETSHILRLSLNIEADGTAWLRGSADSNKCRWVFNGRDEDGGFLLNLQEEEGSAYELVLDEESGYGRLSFRVSDGVELIMGRHDLQSGIVCGSWSGGENGEVYKVEFAPDHSFTANFDGDIKGIWYSGPIYDSNGSETFEITMFYYKEGAGMLARGNFCIWNGSFDSLGQMDDIELEMTLYNAELHPEGVRIYFRKAV